jgi:dTDP-glucose pyrophosphorylase
MLNILIPMSGQNLYESREYQYPKPLTDINGKALIELVVECLNQINGEKRFIFIVNTEDCRRYNLDSVLRLITDNTTIVIPIEKETKGAACSALLAIEHINNSDSLLISNSDHIIDYDLDRVISKFRGEGLDAGAVCFDSVDPKWSYVRLDEDGKIIETAEKRPLSRNAIAGLYYFRQGREFISAAMSTIMKDSSINGQFFISTALNELVLQSKKMEIYKIPKHTYHNLYSSHMLKKYEAKKQYVRLRKNQQKPKR